MQYLDLPLAGRELRAHSAPDIQLNGTSFCDSQIVSVSNGIGTEDRGFSKINGDASSSVYQANDDGLECALCSMKIKKVDSANQRDCIHCGFLCHECKTHHSVYEDKYFNDETLPVVAFVFFLSAVCLAFFSMF